MFSFFLFLDIFSLFFMQAAVQIVTSQIVTSSSCLKVAMYVYYQRVEHIVSPSCSPVDSQLPQLRIHCAQPKPNWKCHTNPIFFNLREF